MHQGKFQNVKVCAGLNLEVLWYYRCMDTDLLEHNFHTLEHPLIHVHCTPVKMIWLVL
jgi:hypothetical protein